MAKRYVLFWFDVEDCTVPQSDDAAKRIAQILTDRGVRGTMKLVGQKARVMQDRVRYDVIDALALHTIGYHANWHGLRPQPAEYMAPLEWPAGAAEFERREGPGIDDLVRLWGRQPACYGQPGPNWSPQVFPALRKWGIPTYVSGYGYVGLHAQPFWYGGLISTSHMFGRDRREREARHAFGLNFELGQPGALDEHKRLFADSYERLEDGGLISIMNHPCTLVLEEWFSTDLKPRELTEAGYAHFDAFVAHVLSHDDAECVTAEDLPALYPDRAMGRVFARDELHTLARGVGNEVYFQELDGVSISAAELFGMFVRFLRQSLAQASVAPGAACAYLDGPAAADPAADAGPVAGGDDFGESVATVARFLEQHGRLPDSVPVSDRVVTPEAYYVGLARAVSRVIEQGGLTGEVVLGPATNRVQDHVDRQAAESGWGSSMMLPGFAAPKLLEQAGLQAWTLKPAILAGP